MRTNRVAVWLTSAYHAGMMKERRFPPPAPELIRGLRLSKEQTLEQMADEFGVRLMTVQHWTSGKAAPQGMNKVLLWRAIRAAGIAEYPEAPE